MFTAVVVAEAVWSVSILTLSDLLLLLAPPPARHELSTRPLYTLIGCFGPSGPSQPIRALRAAAGRYVHTVGSCCR